MKQTDKERMPFQYDQPEVVATKGLKIKPKVSEKKLAEQNQEQHRQDLRERFEKLADQAEATHIDRRQAAYDIARKFITSIRDRQLTRNKSVLVKDVETEIRRDLVTFATEINNDQNEELDCLGSMAVLNLLIKVAFEQRDRINELEYQLVQMDKKLRSSTGSTEPSKDE
jgi:uncharacterized membrane protein